MTRVVELSTLFSGHCLLSKPSPSQIKAAKSEQPRSGRGLTTRAVDTDRKEKQLATSISAPNCLQPRLSALAVLISSTKSIAIGFSPEDSSDDEHRSKSAISSPGILCPCSLSFATDVDLASVSRDTAGQRQRKLQARAQRH